MNDSSNDTRINKVNTQMLNTMYESLQNNPSAMTTATFYVKSNWNVGLVLHPVPKISALVVGPWKGMQNIK